MILRIIFSLIEFQGFNKQSLYLGLFENNKNVLFVYQVVILRALKIKVCDIVYSSYSYI